MARARSALFVAAALAFASAQPPRYVAEVADPPTTAGADDLCLLQQVSELRRIRGALQSLAASPEAAPDPQRLAGGTGGLGTRDPATLRPFVYLQEQFKVAQGVKAAGSAADRRDA
eukprot:CAMPEP_0198553560 /NCGR_PEP_ID=MMETSP1462-20131121/80821_1 /TAXON_ID=1333877 /ORGANISM="Brandtodinium nutriculum, Strain RCC3387" /LENGTH=115 /DNA_ID=CAMNT_0044284249 /DNA_START=14 /DNA_END=357 /DNA_ORIENTATION=+